MYVAYIVCPWSAIIFWQFCDVTRAPMWDAEQKSKKDSMANEGSPTGCPRDQWSWFGLVSWTWLKKRFPVCESGGKIIQLASGRHPAKRSCYNTVVCLWAVCTRRNNYNRRDQRISMICHLLSHYRHVGQHVCALIQLATVICAGHFANYGHTLCRLLLDEDKTKIY